MRNLLKETENFIAKHGKTPEDVRWIGCLQPCYDHGNPYNCTWDEFASIANFEYDDGFGGAEIAMELVVVGTDWWLERHEYDGSEWWKYKSLPEKPEKHLAPTEKLLREYWYEEEETANESATSTS